MTVYKAATPTFGKAVPSFEAHFLDRLVISHDVASTLRAIGEGKGQQDLFRERAPDLLANLRRTAMIESTESSNRLEGVIVPQTVFDRIVLKNADPEPSNRSQGEIAGYRNVLSTIHESHEGMALSSNLLLQLHRDLFRFSPGQGGNWKAGDNQITERRADGTVFVRFQPVAAWRTPEAMSDLHRDFRSAAASVVDPLILVALYILDFLCVHPFSDGNGRLARLITVYLLYSEEYEVVRYISLERLIEETRESYYETLYKSSIGWHQNEHNPMPWVAYFLAVIKAAYEEFSTSVGEIKETRGAKTRLVLQAIDMMRGQFTISELHGHCPSVGFDMVRRVLRSERDAERLAVTGTGRGARWMRILDEGGNKYESLPPFG